MLATVVGAALLSSCGGLEKAPEPRPNAGKGREGHEAPPPVRASVKATDTIVVKKGDRARTEVTYLHRSRPDHVSINVRDADIAKVILPIFKNQVGVRIEYGEKLPRKLHDLTIHDLHWKEALGVLCYMARMHIVAIEGSRILEIRDGYADPARLLSHWKSDRPAGALPTLTDFGKDYTPPPERSSSHDTPAGAEQIEKLRKTVSTTHSGGR